jgi:parvulin-like peptidyl-prolyl isomerase
LNGGGMKKIFIVLTALFLISCNNKELTKDKVIATWRGGQATLSEYEEFAHYYAFNYDTLKAVNTPLEKKREILKHMVNFKLIELLADSLRLDTMKVMKESYARKLVGIAWYHHLYPDSVTNKVIKEEEIKAVYEKMKYEYDVAHILITNKENDADKTLIDSLYSILKNDPSQFSTLAEKYSEDKASAVKGGNLGWNIPTNFVTEFENQVLSLNTGHISKPFKTPFGHHIIINQGKRKFLSLKSFDAEKNSIINNFKKIRANELASVHNVFIDLLLSKYSVKLHKDKISLFLDSFNDYLKGEKNFELGTAHFLKTEILASYGAINVTFGDALKHLSKIDRRITSVITERKIIDIIFSTLYKDIVPIITSDLGYQSKSEVISLAKEGMLVDYKEYFTDKYLGKENEINRWYHNLYTTYNATFYYEILEYAFYKIPDDRK